MATFMTTTASPTPAMRPVAVLCLPDARLWRFFEIELDRLGVTAVAQWPSQRPTHGKRDLTSETCPADGQSTAQRSGGRSTEGRLCLAVVDTDAHPTKEGLFGGQPIQNIPAGCRLLALGRYAPLSLPEDCLFLRRPFDLLKLEHILYALTTDFCADAEAAGLGDALSHERLAVDVRSGLPLQEMPAHYQALPSESTAREAVADRAKSPTMAPSGTAFDDLSLSLDEARGEAVVGSHRVALTKTEALLLRRLIDAAGNIVPREDLAGMVSGGGNTVDVYVCRLRTKIEKPLGRRMIRTVRGVGYTLS